MNGWDALAVELDLWAEAGLSARLWWRDDDAVAPTPALDRLLDVAGDRPLCLAVVPADLAPGLPAHLAPSRRVSVAVHGWAHLDHAAAGAKKAEFGADRPLDVREAEATRGLATIRAAFPHQALDLFVPPWNRMAPDLGPALARTGYRALSTFGPRREARRHGIAILNTHVDPIDWRGGRGFVGEAAALDALVGHLAARRLGKVDAWEPTGLLTHHLVHDPETWEFLAALLPRLDRHPGARLIDVRHIFEGGTS
jgi:hypothetical protein